MSYLPVCLIVRFLYSTITINSVTFSLILGFIALFTLPSYGQVGTSTKEEEELVAQKLMVQAMTQSFLGYHDKAIPLLEQALQVSPSSATINSAIAESHEYLGDFSSAIFYANQALILDSTEIYFHRHLIHLHIQSNDLESSEYLLEGLLKIFPNDITALEDLVEIQTLLGKNDEALGTQNTLLALQGNNRSNLEIKLHLLKVLQDWPAYESTLIELNQVAPHWVMYKQELALFYISQGRQREAIDILQKALDISPDDPTLTSMLANQYRKTGNDSLAQAIQNEQDAGIVTNPDVGFQNALRLVSSENRDASSDLQAISLLEQVIEQSPNHQEANSLLGTLLFEKNLFKEASPILKKAVDLNPRSQDTWLIAIEAFYKAYDYKEAAYLSEDALLLFPGQLPILMLSAEINVGLQEYETALDRVNEYLDFVDRSAFLSDDESNALRAEGLAYSGLIHGLMDLATQSDSLLEAALQSNPGNSQVLALAARSLAVQSRNLEMALQYANEASKIKPDNPEYLVVKGYIQFQQRNYSDSEATLLQVVHAGFPSASAFEYLGDVYLESGSLDEAVASWTKSLEINPGNTTLLEKLKTHSN